MVRIYLLTDYKGNFGSKYTATPYRSGMDRQLLKKYFSACGYDVEYCTFTNIDFRNDKLSGQYVLYTATEDENLYYKGYIEDVVLGLELSGANLLPRFQFLRALGNKVFMEILRDQILISNNEDIQSHHFGTFEEIKQHMPKVQFPVVMKTAHGAMSSGVSLVKNERHLLKQARKISKTPSILHDIKDLLRPIKHHGYIKESKNRRKFIIQTFIPDMLNDWKILIFGQKYYILYRGVRDNDFRASGSGKFVFKKKIPEGILDYAEKIFKKLKVPNLSIDVGHSNGNFYLIEFQAICFGTTTVEKSSFYFQKESGNWSVHEGKTVLEEVYAESIVEYISGTSCNGIAC
ncbi:MAG: hypothetical protein J7K84_02165 [Deltaproteobacteria bacterium]|nr:hypothetical protein [Deltaproteobacteria bacterium]